MLMQLRTDARHLVTHKYYEWFWAILISLNGITLGAETFDSLMESRGELLLRLDHSFLWLFTFEITMRCIVMGRIVFWQDKWNWFDIVVIGLSWLLGQGALSALRILRLARIFRIIPAFRRISEDIAGAVAGAVALLCMLSITVYIFAVMSSKFFGDRFPDEYGNAYWSAVTLVDIFMGNSFASNVRVLIDAGFTKWVFPFFLAYVLLTLFVLGSLLITVLIDAMQKVSNEHLLAKLEALEQKIEHKEP